MTTAHHLRLIDGMRARAFPVERVRTGSGVSGPGYHAAYLHPEDAGYGLGGDDDEADRLERRAQCVADHEALVTLLGSRWGEPQLVSLFSARERMVSGEELPEPWADVVAGCEYLRLWQVEERWIALALCLEEGGSGCELSVVVTETDPP
ncbi:hypothetical protein MHW47_24615 [Streptomyces sp. OfavH-34-F]|uniref:hypothetical protein n=1 Tax=Streptomyces sp. OfavH-34-F TaxID=2917760 RepID=UPI001EF342B2|nr:hypothetical protein [Streptomyces sp. OfavH-34-F]MCG7527607.1 hypothetical protein [Streptomyces sp. OfavH-34-F]